MGDDVALAKAGTRKTRAAEIMNTLGMDVPEALEN
jgi:hypothetical protein